jgi:acetoin utilization protein AcuB
MLVQDRMIVNPVTATPDTVFLDALRMMREGRFRHLPVVSKKGELVGIITQTDLLHASPSSATALSVSEVNYLLANLRIGELMSGPPITVPEDAPLEEAARVMVENKIGCLPVMRAGARSKGSRRALVGLITETDIFKSFVEILGGEDASLRVTLRVPDVRGELARLAGLIAQLGGNICSVAAFRGEDPEHAYLTVRLEGVDEEVLMPALESAGEKVVHVCCAS